MDSGGYRSRHYYGTADNDAGGITTYSVVGSAFGYKMMWILFIIAFILAITGNGRTPGVGYRQGLAVLWGKFSLKVTTFVVLVTFAANWVTSLPISEVSRRWRISMGAKISGYSVNFINLVHCEKRFIQDSSKVF